MPPDKASRCTYETPLSDLIVVLGKGIIQFDNSPLSPPYDSIRHNVKGSKWLAYQSKEKNLLMLFLQLVFYISHVPMERLIISAYTEKISFNNLIVLP